MTPVALSLIGFIAIIAAASAIYSVETALAARRVRRD
jgi:hypothetical protein